MDCVLMETSAYKRFMYKKLCILLIFSKLKLFNRKYSNTILAKNPNPYKQIVGNLVNESGNMSRRGVVLRP